MVLLTTSGKGRANVMTMSWHMMVEFEPPLLACVVSSDDFSFAALRASRECVIAVPAVVQAWADPKQPAPKTIHHQGYGRFVVDGEIIELKSRMR